MTKTASVLSKMCTFSERDKGLVRNRPDMYPNPNSVFPFVLFNFSRKCTWKFASLLKRIGSAFHFTDTFWLFKSFSMSSHPRVVANPHYFRADPHPAFLVLLPTKLIFSRVMGTFFTYFPRILYIYKHNNNYIFQLQGVPTNLEITIYFW